MTEKENQEKEATSPKIYWELEVKDKAGKLLQKTQAPAKSWLVAFIKILKGEFATRHAVAVGEGNVSPKNEGGTDIGYPIHRATSYTSCSMQLSTLGDTADVTQGIIVGRGNTANDLTTYKLETKVAHGTGANQLLYGAESIEDVTNPSGNDLQFRITRTFTNNTGSTVTVTEIGMLVNKYSTTGADNSWLVSRDVLGSPTDVPDGATLTIRYVVKITVA